MFLEKDWWIYQIFGLFQTFRKSKILTSQKFFFNFFWFSELILKQVIIT